MKDVEATVSILDGESTSDLQDVDSVVYLSARGNGKSIVDFTTVSSLIPN